MNASDFFTLEQITLLKAIEDGDSAKAQALLNNGLTLNFHGEEGITPLFWLIMRKDHRAVELALELGADPNMAAPDGDTPLTLAAGGNDEALLRLLLEHEGNPNARNRNGEPALFGAISQERWSNIKILLEFGADLNQTDRSGTNSTHHAAYLNKYEIVHFLIAHGAEYAARDETGGNIAWLVHEGLTENLLSPELEAHGWALKVKQQLIERGVKFPPPSPREVRIREGRPNQWDLEAMKNAQKNRR